MSDAVFVLLIQNADFRYDVFAVYEDFEDAQAEARRQGVDGCLVQRHRFVPPAPSQPSGE